jgi:preprotein translocase subunit SecA
MALAEWCSNYGSDITYATNWELGFASLVAYRS